MKTYYKKRNATKTLVLGIIIGIIISIGGIYWYENTPKIIQMAGQINNKTNTFLNNYINNTSNSIDTHAIALQTHDLINQQRDKAGITALIWNNNLAEIAMEHSKDMIKNNYFDHNDLQGHDPSYRIQQVENNCLDASENIAWTKGYTSSQIAHAIVDWWMNSFEHRANILRSSFTSEGIGVDINGSYAVATEDFC